MIIELTEQEVQFVASVLANTPISAKRDDAVRIIGIMDGIMDKLRSAVQQSKKPVETEAESQTKA